MSFADFCAQYVKAGGAALPLDSMRGLYTAWHHFEPETADEREGQIFGG